MPLINDLVSGAPGGTGSLYTGTATVPGLAAGGVVTLDETGATATTRHLTTLHIGTLKVDVGTDGAASGQCQPDAPVAFFSPSSGAGLAPLGNVCSAGGALTGMPAYYGTPAVLDDQSGGSTSVSAPALSDQIPAADDSVPGTFVAYANLTGTGSSAQVLGQVASVHLRITSRAGGSTVFSQTASLTSDLTGPYATAAVTGLAAGAYLANWKVTDKDGDTAAYKELFAVQAAATGPAGPTGPQGTTGATGPQGTTGATGPQGTTGATGPQGATGATGPAPGPAGGPPGPQGATGAPGAAGLAGANGAQGLPAPPAPPDPRARPGGTGSQGRWWCAGTAGGLTGPQGPQGPAGKNGTSSELRCVEKTTGSGKHKRTAQQCTVTVISTGSHVVSVALSRAGKTYAIGTAITRRGAARFRLQLVRRMKPARYLVTVLASEGTHAKVVRYTRRFL